MSALLPIRKVEKPWGRDRLPSPFTAPTGKRIGEIWFEPPPALDSLLVKYLFTSEKLSVQVHPGGAAGKEECWLILEADPGAVLGVGFREDVDAQTMRAAALDGSIENMLAWHEVTAGDFIYVPAGSVHAIGAGVSLIEIQQNCDTTFRLYDYGRPRELHLDDAVAIAHGRPHDPALRFSAPADGNTTLADGPWFRVDRIAGTPEAALAERYRGALLAIPLAGDVSVGGEMVAPGECALAPDIEALSLSADAQCLLAQPCGDSA